VCDPATGLVVSGGRIVTGHGGLAGGRVVVRDGVVASVCEREMPGDPITTMDATGWLVLPGFVDVHCHGGGGSAFSSGEDAVATAVATHRRHGTTRLLASLVSRPVPELVEQVTMLADHVLDRTLAGIHLEGPFLSAARCGAQNPAALCAPDQESVAKLVDAGRGTIRMVTIAPELDGALTAIRQLVDAGVTVAVGHTDARTEQVLPAIEAGATVATHLFNGMRGLHHREPGPVGALLDDERVSVELICDLVHLHPLTARLAARYAGPERTVLITDAISATDAGDGEYELGGLPVLVRDGKPRLSDGSLAGSTLTMDAALRNYVDGCGMSLADAVMATALRPAALLGLPAGLRPGAPADLVLLDSTLSVRRVMVAGEWVAGC
jgi:N-acetylglucosamine-6-phosphate deacetylase